jgi:hypothetical protein
VFSRLTALRLDEQTTQAPFGVWIASAALEHPLRLDDPSLRILRVSPAALAAGMESSQVESVPVWVISAAKTVARVHGTLYRHRRPDRIGSSRSDVSGHGQRPTQGRRSRLLKATFTASRDNTKAAVRFSAALSLPDGQL